MRTELSLFLHNATAYEHFFLIIFRDPDFQLITAQLQLLQYVCNHGIAYQEHNYTNPRTYSQSFAKMRIP